MAANLTYHQPIKQVKTTSGNAPITTGAYEEAASQTWAPGAPVMLDGNGRLVVWDGTSLTNGILGVAPYNGNNLASAGLGHPVEPFGSVGQGASLTFSSVPNQASAVNIPMGAPMVDGRHVIYFANEDTWFEAQIDNSAAGAYATALTQLGKAYGLTADASSPAQWYVDLNKSTSGVNTCVVVMALNPLDPIGTNGGRVWFKFQGAAVVGS
jgi:hypothetical protein